MKTSAPLSKNQYGVYVECMQHTGEVYYNLPFLYVLDSSLDEKKLKTAIEAAVAAHPTLFTRIELNEQGEPVQCIDDSETLSLEVEHITDIETEKKGLITPFDLYKDRLFHIRLLKDSQHFYLFADTHHIISDGTAQKVLLNDINAAYGGKPLEPETITQADVAREEAERRQTPAFEEDKQWYAENFDCRPGGKVIGDRCSYERTKYQHRYHRVVPRQVRHLQEHSFFCCIWLPFGKVQQRTGGTVLHRL